MESSFITDIFLPLALFIIMLGMGLSLQISDFRRVVLYPKAVFLGLTNQLILLPIVGYAIAVAFGLSTEMAVGLMILAACPGGATSNLIAHIAKGDTALSITLTAISSLVTIITIPFIVNFALENFSNGGQDIQLPIPKTILTIVVIIIIPVSIGMLIKAKNATFALKMDKPVRIVSAAFLALIVIGAILKEKAILVDAFKEVGLSTLSLNLVTMLIGFLTAKAFRLNVEQAKTVSIESGIQNGTLAIFIATTLLKNSQMSIPPAIYSLVMFGTAGVAIFFFSKMKSEEV